MTGLHKNLKKLRHDRRLTQKQVAEAIDISQGNYSAIEAGKFDPSLSTLCKLADFFNESLDTLTNFIQIIDEDEPLSKEEEEWLDYYRNMTSAERSLMQGIVSVVKTQSQNPRAFLPKSMDVIDYEEERLERSSKDKKD